MHAMRAYGCAMNRAAQILAERFQERGAQIKLADETGVDQGYLSKLARGERVAGLDVRRKLIPYGIQMEWWDEPAEAEAEAS